jgi:hypothetical protein
MGGVHRGNVGDQEQEPGYIRIYLDGIRLLRDGGLRLAGERHHRVLIRRLGERLEIMPRRNRRPVNQLALRRTRGGGLVDYESKPFCISTCIFAGSSGIQNLILINFIR